MARTKYAARRFLVGLGAIGASLVLVYLAFTANQGRLPGAPVTTVRAAFDDVGQLQAGSEVRQNGEIVGQVSAVELVSGKPLVTMKLTSGAPVYRDGYAGIWDQSALAQKFVELRSGNAASGPLGDAVLPASQTESTHDLVSVLDVFDPPTRAALGSASSAPPWSPSAPTCPGCCAPRTGCPAASPGGRSRSPSCWRRPTRRCGR